MNKKWLVFVLILLLASIIFVSKAEAATGYGSSFFTNVAMQNQNGEDETNFKENSKIRVTYDFEITQPVASGETMTLTIPEQLKLINFGNFLVNDPDGNTIAEATINPTTGVITITFTDYVNTHTGLRGSLFYNASFNKNNIQIDKVNTILFPVNNTTQVWNAYIGKVSTDGGGAGSPTVVFKQGRMDKNDPSILHWTVTLNNALLPIENAIYTDTLGSGQNLLGDVTIKYRDVNKKTILTKKQSISLDNNRNFQLTIGTLNDQSVVITYDSKITSKQKSYTNKATLTGDNLEIISRNASVIDYGSGGQGSGITPSIEKEEPYPPVKADPPSAVKEEPPLVPAESQPIEKVVETDFGPLEIVKDSSEGDKIKVIYKVKSGDTLSGIAKKFEVTTSDIKDWNNFTSDALQVGQKLQLTIDKTLLDNITIVPTPKVTNMTKIGDVVEAKGTLPHTGDMDYRFGFIIGLGMIAFGLTSIRKN